MVDLEKIVYKEKETKVDYPMVSTTVRVNTTTTDVPVIKKIIK